MNSIFIEADNTTVLFGLEFSIKLSLFDLKKKEIYGFILTKDIL